MYVDLTADQEAGPSATLNVDPAKLTQVQQGFEAEIERLQSWKLDYADPLAAVPHAGGDNCSKHMSNDLSNSGKSALEAMDTYIERLRTAALKLSESAKAYQLQEEHNASKFRQEPE